MSTQQPLKIQLHELAQKLLCQYADVLACLDEPLLAVDVLTKYAPSFYRDNPSDLMKSLKKDIISSLFTLKDYQDTEDDLAVPMEDARLILEDTMRGLVIKDFVTRENKNQRVPEIFDLGPGNFFVPVGLQQLNLNFKYSFNGVNTLAKEAFSKYQIEPCTDANTFIAFEIIEHVFDPLWLRQEQIQNAPNAKNIFLSTPKYCFDHCKWRNQKQPHFRAYTPHEFIQEARRLWPEFKWSFVDNQVMVLIGEL